MRIVRPRQTLRIIIDHPLVVRHPTPYVVGMAHDDTLIYLAARQWPSPDRDAELNGLAAEDARWVRGIWTRLDRRWKDQDAIILANVLSQVRAWDGQFD